LIRDDKHLFAEVEPSLGDIIGFEITDNGVGFNNENYHAFETSDTTYKEQRGGKGVGRFQWLVAFESVHIDSKFLTDGRMMRRTFDFVAQGKGIRDFTEATASSSQLATKIRLSGFSKKYREQCPKRIDTIAVRLMEHCLEYFIGPDCPRIRLVDHAAGEAIELNDLFEQEIGKQSSKDEILAEGNLLHVFHVRLYGHARDHHMHFCANNRVVRSERLLNHISLLRRRLQDGEGREFVYAAYVDGALLDESVNAERTDFAIVEDRSDLLADTVTWPSIREAVVQSSKEFLKPYTDPIRAQNRLKIEEYVASEAPAYRPILSHIENKLDSIDADAGDDGIEMSLYRAYQELQVEIRDEGRTLFAEVPPDQEWKDFEDRLQQYFEKVSDVNKSDLARYVTHRRAILEFLQLQLTSSPAGGYRLEDRIHRIIFPLRKTSSDVPFEEHNLWLLDERLVYHAFLASDQPLNAGAPHAVDSQDRPDIVVFDKALALSASESPYSAITIVEFKRPMRSPSANDNPFVQVRRYITAIQEGKARMEDGRDVPIVNRDIPFFCYVVCDITPSLRQLALDFELSETPDHQGFFGWKKHLNAYVEVVSFTKMVDNAKKRNAVFFDKLGLPNRIPSIAAD
jgi:hypothetical protein